MSEEQKKEQQKLDEQRINQQIAGKHLLFNLAGENYGLPILQVREIISFEDVTQVPRTSSCVLGVINLRGKVIPVIDLRIRFSLPPCLPTEKTVIIVLQCQLEGRLLTIGAVVDNVQEVMLVRSEDISVPPAGTSIGDEFIVGIATPGNNSIVFLLDVIPIVGFAGEGALSH